MMMVIIMVRGLEHEICWEESHLIAGFMPATKSSKSAE